MEDTANNSAVRVKREPTSSSDEMKEFAETAMNELLGWYGYEPPGDDDDDDDAEDDAHLPLRSAGDTSGPEYSDSGSGVGGIGGIGGGSGGSGAGGARFCGWCSRPMGAGAQTTGAFCSELCFSQSRRASFKRNRTCDWCRHVRHTVAHVDVRDGARHLQFCSDKCLNQYKMHIFCRETQAHLELHPHNAPGELAHSAGVPSGDAGLITPDLWLKDCKDTTPPDRLTSSPPVAQSQINIASKTRPGRRPSAITKSPLCTYPNRRRTATVTSTSQQENFTDLPQDLRVRARSPADRTPTDRTPTPTRPSSAVPGPEPIPNGPESRNQRIWPPAPPPITILVPYPVVVPVPVPLPVPIPIPLPDELFRKARSTFTASTTPNTSTSAASTVTPTVSTSSATLGVTMTTSSAGTGASENKEEDLVQKPLGRTLRARKRPAATTVGPGDTTPGPDHPRRTVPA